MVPIVDKFPVYQNLANGDIIIILYDVFVFLLFVFEFFLYINKERFVQELKTCEEKKIKPLRKFFVRLAVNYDRHGLITVTGLLFFISLLVISRHHMVTFTDVLGIFISLLIFTMLVYFVQRIFMRLNQFQDAVVSRFVDLIFYLMLGHAFVMFENFIAPPTLPLGLIGLGFALILCYSVMLRAIVNPSMIRSSVSKRRQYQESAAILKGMLAIVLCEVGILYLMVFNCFKINPGLYVSSDSRILNAFDMLYYLIISFATIGYGDIHPVRLGGLFYSELVAMIIGMTSMFSTAIFVGAIVAGATQLSRMQLEETSKDMNSEKTEIVPGIREKFIEKFKYKDK
ncbi:potassium channel family protein [Acetobacterium sp.]|uniref:potassium channel family protein n=1 Tax=Acetobacterium sp. TaxID=1872094 RepID=UPI002F4189A7